MKEKGSNTYEGMIWEGINLKVQGTGPEDMQIWVNNRPVSDMKEAVELAKKLHKEKGIVVQLAPFSGNVHGIDYDLKKYIYDNARKAEQIEISWSEGGNKIELSVETTGTGGTHFNWLKMNGTDVTQAAQNNNWTEIAQYYDPSENFDFRAHIFKPVTTAFEDSASKNAKDLDRWDQRPGTFFTWLQKEGYSIEEENGRSVVKITGSDDDVTIVEAGGGKPTTVTP
jgi:hypothetical protein